MPLGSSTRRGSCGLNWCNGGMGICFHEAAADGAEGLGWAAGAILGADSFEGDVACGAATSGTKASNSTDPRRAELRVSFFIAHLPSAARPLEDPRSQSRPQS